MKLIHATVILSCLNCANIDPRINDKSWHMVATNPIVHDKAAVSKVIELVESACCSIQIAIYQINYPELIQLLARKHHKGLHIEIIGDAKEDKKGRYSQLREQGLQVYSGNRSGIMHHKFMIIDKKILFWGSGNFTTTGLLHNYNQFLYTQEDVVVSAFLAEYERLRAGDFGLEKEGLTSTHENIFFLPQQQDELIRLLRKKIQHAKHSILFMLFSFSHDDLATSLIESHAGGVDVWGVIDQDFRSGISQEFPRLKIAGLPVKTMNRRSSLNGKKGGKQHSKTWIIDDQVFFGTFNWSQSARFVNDEAVLLLNSGNLLEFFIKEANKAFSLSDFESPEKERLSNFNLKIEPDSIVTGLPSSWQLLVSNASANPISTSYMNFIIYIGDESLIFTVDGESSWYKGNYTQCKEQQIANGICALSSQTFAFATASDHAIALGKREKSAQLDQLVSDFCGAHPTRFIQVDLADYQLDTLQTAQVSCGLVTG